MAKRFKIFLFFAVLFVTVFAGIVIYQTPFVAIFSISKTLNANYEMIEKINTEKPFGKFVYASFDETIEASTGQKDIKVDLKLFNLITLKTFYVNSNEIELYVGGDVVGFSLNGDGIVIIGTGFVETSNGKVNTTKNSDIKKGDIIKEIAGEKVLSVADICRVANAEKNKDRELSLKIKRNDKYIETNILNALDENSGIYKLGLWVKDDVSGIGTLTYVRKDNNRFGALGHAICDNDTKTVYQIDSGEMYPCTIIGVKRGTKGNAGELKGLFMQGKNNKLGEVDKNLDYGVFGEVTDEKIETNKDVLIAGGRLYAKPGKAYIRTAVDGKVFKDYEIEIIKTNYQSTSNEKSMVIRVTDKELLEKTGGIVQGMSGSPIIQNNRVIGAVTHVFINDPTKGFGIYLDWMINQ